MSTIKVDNLDTSNGTGNITLSRPIAGDGSNLTGVSPTKATVEALGIELPAANLTGTIHADRYTDTVYTHPTTAGNKHIPTAGATDQVLTYSSSGTAAWADLAGNPFELITHESSVKTSGIQLDFGDMSVSTSSPTKYAAATVTFNAAFSVVWAVAVTGVSRISSTQCYAYSRWHNTTSMDVSVFNDYDSDSRTYELNWIAIGAKA